MRVESAFFANHVEVRDGVLFASAAYPEWWAVPSLPSEQDLHMAVVVALDPEEINQTFDWQLSVVPPEGLVKQFGEFSTTRQQTDPPHTHPPIFDFATVALRFTFDATGLWTFVVSCSEPSVSTAIPLWVRLFVPKP